MRPRALNIGALLLLSRLCTLQVLAHKVEEPTTVRPAVEAGSGSLAGGCPAKFPRMTVEQVAEGTQQPGGLRPYIFGGRLPPQAGRDAESAQCSNCTQPREWWADLCSFKYTHYHVESSGNRWATIQVCSDDVQRQMVRSWVERGYTAFLTMTPCDLWSHLAGRTLFVMGDSISQDLTLSLICFLFEMRAGPILAEESAPWPWLKHPITDSEALAELPPDIRGNSGCVAFVEDTRICFLRTDLGQNFHGAVLPWLLRHELTRPDDIIVGNFGLHHGQEYANVVRDFTRWYAEQKQQLPRFFWQQTTQQHYMSPSGESPGGGLPFRCKPLEGYSVQGDGMLVLEEGKEDVGHLLEGGWRNAAATPLIAAAGIPIVGSFNETVPMWRSHRDNGSGQDCTHYCMPSAQQSALASLLRALQAVEPTAAEW